MKNKDLEYLLFPQKPEEKWLFLAFGIVLLAIGSILVPGQELWNGFSTTRSLIPNSKRMTIEEVRTELATIKGELGSLTNGYSDGDTAYRHMNRLFYIERHLPFSLYQSASQFYAEFGQIGMTITQLKYQSSAFRNAGNRERNLAIRDRFSTLRDNNPNSEMGLNPRDTIATDRHWGLVPEHLKRRIPFSAMFMFFFFVSMLMYHDKLIEEVRDYLIFRIAVASVVWPIAMWVFPSRFMAYKAARTLVWLRYALSAGISLAPAMLKAQLKPGVKEKKSSPDHALIIEKRNQAASAPPWKLSVDFFGDSRHDRQFNLRTTRGWFTFFNQNRVTADGKSSISLVGAGPSFSVGKDLKFFITAGPQYTNGIGIDRTVVFTNGAYSSRKILFKFVNRLSFGHKDKATPFADRHIQEVRGPPFPSWLSLEGEESHTSGKWRELFFGPKINLGGLIRRKGILDSISLYPHWDFAKGNFDLRVWLSFSFGQ